MTNRELIRILLDQDLNLQVARSAGEDPNANLLVRKVRIGKSYVLDQPIIVLD